MNPNMKDFRPRLTRSPQPEQVEPCYAPGCAAPSTGWSEPFVASEIRVEGRTVAPIRHRVRYCDEHSNR